jgi:hypothetical protein
MLKNESEVFTLFTRQRHNKLYLPYFKFHNFKYSKPSILLSKILGGDLISAYSVYSIIHNNSYIFTDYFNDGER